MVRTWTRQLRAREGLLHASTTTRPGQLASLLDEATVSQVVDWLERTREAALHLAPAPARPAYRRPRPDSRPQRT
ncbi:hypothetical protein [Streptomyces sp. NPDC004284]|uniref:hypothetical protein n=1 Tax=Streptomyces sp. NPDC004284 TaxID=3364695 RepID=UPI0036811B52